MDFKISICLSVYLSSTRLEFVSTNFNDVPREIHCRHALVQAVTTILMGDLFNLAAFFPRLKTEPEINGRNYLSQNRTGRSSGVVRLVECRASEAAARCPTAITDGLLSVRARGSGQCQVSGSASCWL